MPLSGNDAMNPSEKEVANIDAEPSDLAAKKREKSDESIALTAAGAALGAALPSGLSVVGLASVLGGILAMPFSPLILAIAGAGSGALIAALSTRKE